MKILALIWGLLAITGFGIAFVPCFGSLNWINIPFAVIGLVIAIMAASSARPGTRGPAIAGAVLCGIAIVLGLIRLAAGSFIL